MEETPPQTLLEHLQTLEDPRRTDSTLHPLPSILFMGLCAVICGAETWVAMEEWARAREDWLRSAIDLPHGIPSHDTFARVFSLLEPLSFATMFTRWVEGMMERTEGGVVAIDGKTLRRSLSRATGKAAVHMVSAWAADNQLVLGQLRTDPESNEITTVPELLGLLRLRGCLVTLDAMNTQKAIAAQLVEQQADYVLPVKDNHPTLLSELAAAFEGPAAAQFEGTSHGYAETRESEHGRHEIRQLWCINKPRKLDPDRHWTGLRSVAMIRRIRTVGEHTSFETAYFISTLPGNKARSAHRLLDAIRAHWSIENGLHWRLDVQFDEDHSRTYAGNAAENLARVRHMAINLLKRDDSVRVGIKIKRQKAGWDHNYLLKILGVGA
jgi:predicted transposase YbfD/YdcC